MQDVIGDESRNEEGVLFHDRIRQDVVSIDVAWMATGEQAAVILSAIEEQTLSVDYFDPKVNSINTAQMYASDRSCELVLYKGDGNEANLWSIGFSLIQF